MRAADEVRAAEFDFEGEPDEQMVELAETIMDRLEGEWDASKFHDRYQDALRALIEAKEKQLPIPKAGPAPAATNVVDLMAVLKQSLAQTGAAQSETPRNAEAGKKARADQRQRSMLLPVTGGGEKAAAREEKPAKPARRRKAS